MAADDPRQWMWGAALDMLARAGRLSQATFQPVRNASEQPSWTPPIDMLETEHEVWVIAALPGVRESELALFIDG